MNGIYAGILFLLFIPFLIVAVCAVLGLIRSARTRHRPPLAALILFGVGVLLLLVSAVLFILGQFANLHLFLRGLGLYQWQFILRILIIPCLLFGGLFVAVRKVLCWRTLVYCSLLCVWFFLFSAGSLFLRADAVYTEVSSPASVGEVHDLVFEERSFFASGTGYVYEKVSPCFMRKIGGYTTDDGCTPVAHRSCSFVWQEDGFTMKHQREEEFRYVSE